MARKMSLPGLKGLQSGIKPFFPVVIMLLLISFLAGCGAPAASIQASTTSASVPVSQAPTSVASAAAPTTTAAAAKPQGELVGALQSFGNENWLPWLDPNMSNLHDLVYDFLIYWDNANLKYEPGLAESWENSLDGMTLTYHLRQGVEWQEGWGEFTSADVKYNFEMQASPKSVGKTAQCRRIASMDTPDPYTLVVHFKDSYPTFFADMSMANSATCQGIVCKKYAETVGEDAAAEKPIGTGPYKLIDSQLGSYYKFEALDSHWRVVPEFKYLTVRLITEMSTLAAALKTKEIDTAINIPAEQMAVLEAAGVAVEASPLGGNVLMVDWGGMVISADKRYDATYHNKDPWVDMRVRKAMAISIDREAICKAIYAGLAKPIALPVYSPGMEKYQYPYDPVAAKQLLKDAGYPNGFSFKLISYVNPSSPETPRVVEAVAGFWQQIGLDPKITTIDYNTYYSKNVATCRTAGEIFLYTGATVADMLTKIETFLMPNATNVIFEDEESYAIYLDNPKETMEQRIAVVEKLNQYYFDNFGPIPLVRVGRNYAWNADKMAPWPHPDSSRQNLWEYARHTQPLNTFRLFTPWPGR